MLVLDASVVYKWFQEETESEIALRIRDEFVNEGLEIAVPDLILYEVSNALRYNDDFDEKGVKDAIASLYDMELKIIAPTTGVVSLAIEIAFEKDITVYDACYLALAEEIDFSFITADEKLYDKISDVKVARLLKNY